MLLRRLLKNRKKRRNKFILRLKTVQQKAFLLHCFFNLLRINSNNLSELTLKAV